MFKFIGGVVVYGFALFGVFKVLEGKAAAERAGPGSNDTD